MHSMNFFIYSLIKREGLVANLPVWRLSLKIGKLEKGSDLLLHQTKCDMSWVFTFPAKKLTVLQKLVSGKNKNTTIQF